MKKGILVFAVIFLTLLACKNPPFDARQRFWVENKSDELIMTLRSYQYPDTTIPDRKEELGGILPGHKAPYDFDIKNWTELFDQLPRDTLSIFIFHSDTIAKYSWPEIQSGYKILRRYDLSLKDLLDMNGIIQYP